MSELQPTDPRQVGRYRITGLLGAGGMGRVYLGHSPGGRLVAVKVVRPDLAEDPGFRRRFAREVAAARKVNGFFTAAVVDADPDGSPPWLATAYVPGLPLDKAVAAHGPWPAESVRALGAGLAEALEAIHAAGLVHRDLKPSNVLIAPDGPRVVDFGISVAAEATALTSTGMVVGTPGFMAPEQLTGKPVTPATDVFALGAVLAYAATGVGPFGAGSAQALNFRIVYEEPDLAELPAPGLEIIARCLAKDHARRPAVAELVEELALVPPADGYTPTEVVPRAAAWLPGPVARALPATVTAPTPPAPPQPVAAPPDPAPAQPAAAPAADVPPAHAPVPPAAPAPPPAHHRAVLPLWTALVALAFAMVLPASHGENVAKYLDEGSWPFAVVAVLSAGTSAAALTVLRRAPAAPVPRWIRRLHMLTTALSTALFAVFVILTYDDEGDLDSLGPGAWIFAFGCAVLTYSLFRFPTPRRPPAP
ncbi:serine/threonine-protein kinase [Streptomyces cuspidosporus]|uniref:Protein kinase domain-containing protein n=1 Tax=Streptomyces cuspidosporus TaxID=66882 RepID=A0ABP5SE23_9ACTN